MLSGARPRLLGAAHPRPARVCVVLQPSAASSQLAWSNANSTAPGLLPAATDVTYVLGQYSRALAGAQQPAKTGKEKSKRPENEQIPGIEALARPFPVYWNRDAIDY